MSRTWLAYANRKKCHHREALEEMHFISWSMKSANFKVGDTVYLYMSDEKSIRFKTEVVAEKVKREDGDYWQEPTSNNLTYKLALRKEYLGDDLTEAKMILNGYKRSSLERPIYNNPRLFAYIEKTFNDDNQLTI